MQMLIRHILMLKSCGVDEDYSLVVGCATECVNNLESCDANKITAREFHVSITTQHADGFMSILAVSYESDCESVNSLKGSVFS